MRATRPTAGHQLRSVSLRYRQELCRPHGGRLDATRGFLSPKRPWSLGSHGEENAAAPRGDRLARVEAVLFLAHEPLSLRRIGQFASLADATEARTLIRRLNQSYDRLGRAFRIEEVAGGFQLLTRRKFGGWLRRLFETPVQTRLSSPALETLAVIAYRQPVLRVDIEAVRGVQCGEMLRQLMDRDLVRIVGRSDDLGRPFLYGTTKRFLQVFGLRRLDELPRAEELRAGPPTAAAGTTTNQTTSSGVGRNDDTTSPEESTEELAVSIAVEKETPAYEVAEDERLPLPGAIRAADEEDEEWEEDDDEDEDDDDEEEEDEDLDDDFEDEDWEEVDDEELDEDDEEWDEDDDEDDDDDEDWDEDDDDDADDDEGEEEEP